MSERVQEEKHSLMKDMTSGNPTALILGFAIPMLLGTLFQQFYSMVDTIIVGRLLGVDALAGVGSTGAVNFMINGFVIGTCSMVGVPFFAGFTSKVYLAMNAQDKGIIFLVALAISSCLNAIYYLPVAIRIFSKAPEEATAQAEKAAEGSVPAISIACFSVINIALGVAGLVLITILAQGVQIL